MSFIYKFKQAEKNLFDASEDSKEWKPTEAPDDFFGPDETEYWEKEDAERKAHVKQERAAGSKSRNRKIDQLDAEIIQWEQPDNLDTTLLSHIEAAHKRLPRPVTYTVVNPLADPSDPEVKRRIFENLRKQLRKEVEKAVASGSGSMLTSHEVESAKELADPLRAWDDVEMALWEPHIREIVKLMIAKRRDAVVA